jgi:FkbM family methyltransferase
MSLLIQLGLQINKILLPFGLQLSRSPSGPEWRRMRLIETRGIKAVVDIGANEGQYGQRLRQLGYQDWVYSYEPLPSAFARLRDRSRSDPRWQAFQVAVGDTAGAVTMNVAHNSESSSILQIAKPHLDAEPAARTVARVEVNATTLDSILQGLPAQPTLLKIDTQGFEDRVLASGMNALGNVELLEVELSLFEVYLGQTLFRDMDARIVGAGFELVSLAEGFFDRRTGELLQVDAIYARPAGRIQRSAANVVTPRKPSL